MIDDAKVAADYMRAEQGCERLGLIGICSGGEVAVGAMHDGLRVDAAALWSSPVFSAEGTTARKAKKSLSYVIEYVRKALRPETWRKLIGGRIRFGIIKRVLFGGGTHEKSEGERAELTREDTLAGGCSGMLLIYGTADPIAEEAIALYTELFTRSGAEVELHSIEGANHGFYSGPWHEEVVERTTTWLVELAAEKQAQ